MSYDIRVVNKKSGDTISLRQKHEIKGGTYAVGGTSEASLNITYNYAKWFYELWPHKEGKEVDVSPFGEMFNGNEGGIRSLYGLPMKEVLEKLNEACEKLHGDPSEDYWASTEGNARNALFDLKLICEMAAHENPDEELTIMGD